MRPSTFGAEKHTYNLLLSVFFVFLKAQCFHSTTFHSAMRLLIVKTGQYVLDGLGNACAFPLRSSVRLSYGPDGTAVLCVELSQTVSDGVWAKLALLYTRVRALKHGCVCLAHMHPGAFAASFGLIGRHTKSIGTYSKVHIYCLFGLAMNGHQNPNCSAAV